MAPYHADHSTARLAKTDGLERGVFRSYGETQIARCLNRHRIPYLYEHPLAAVDQGKTKIWHPDFQLAGYGMLIEYCGRPDDPHYADGMAKKHRVYAANGLTALMVTPDIFRGDWAGHLLDRIEGVFANRIQHFQALRANA